MGSMGGPEAYPTHFARIHWNQTLRRACPHLRRTLFTRLTVTFQFYLWDCSRQDECIARMIPSGVAVPPSGTGPRFVSVVVSCRQRLTYARNHLLAIDTAVPLSWIEVKQRHKCEADYDANGMQDTTNHQSKKKSVPSPLCPRSRVHREKVRMRGYKIKQLSDFIPSPQPSPGAPKKPGIKERELTGQ